MSWKRESGGGRKVGVWTLGGGEGKGGEMKRAFFGEKASDHRFRPSLMEERYMRGFEKKSNS